MKIFKKSNEKVWEVLENVNYSNAERDIESLLYDSYGAVIPVEEIGQGQSSINLLLRQVSLETGIIDLIGLNGDGDIFLIDCKLYKNPEQKRKVVAQLIDYGQSLWRLSYQDFLSILEEQSGKYSKENMNRLESFSEELEDEKKFQREINESFKEGKFCYLIAGDEIRKELKDIIEFLRSQGINIFALEVGVFKDEKQEYIAPRIYGAEIEKAENYYDGKSGRITVENVLEKWAGISGEKAKQYFRDLHDRIRKSEIITASSGFKSYLGGISFAGNILKENRSSVFLGIYKEKEEPKELFYIYSHQNKLEKRIDRKTCQAIFKNIAEKIKGEYFEEANYLYVGFNYDKTKYEDLYNALEKELFSKLE